MVRLATLVAVVVAVVVIFRHDPLASAVYPACPVRSLTGFECMGCGSARALHSLLHLQLGRAVDFNVLVVLALPWVAFRYGRWVAGAPAGAPPASPRTIGLVGLGLVAFAVARNLPWPLGGWLAAG